MIDYNTIIETIADKAPRSEGLGSLINPNLTGSAILTLGVGEDRARLNLFLIIIQN